MLTADLDEVLQAAKDDAGRRWGWTTTFDVANLPTIPLVSMGNDDRRHFQSVAVRLRLLEQMHYLEQEDDEPGWWCLL